ncbi:hypothetical protein ACN28I_10465 [Archangium gephyra]|uniref:hypothetical protein n=1 Tax=Archangium gephyra TaxID=48 RepID=UPI003B81BE99
MDRARLLLIGVTAIAVASCQKVPIVDIHAGFSLADVAWFDEEDTLFVFYQANAEQGLGPESQIEFTYRTDHFELPWTPLSRAQHGSHPRSGRLRPQERVRQHQPGGGRAAARREVAAALPP